MNVVDRILSFIHNELKAAYGTEAEVIMRKLDCRLEELQEDTDDEFQILLQTFVYPFLACVDAMKTAGYREKEAVEFGKGVWYKLTPVLFRG